MTRVYIAAPLALALFARAFAIDVRAAGFEVVPVFDSHPLVTRVEASSLSDDVDVRALALEVLRGLEVEA